MRTDFGVGGGNSLASPSTANHRRNRGCIRAGSPSTGCVACGWICALRPQTEQHLVGDNGEVRVIDLGQAAKIGTKKKRVQGTPDFMAPEQVKLEAVTVKTDVF